MQQSKIKDEDLIEVKRYIEEQQAPLFFKNEHGKFCLVITEVAKRKYLNEGFIAITLNELRNWIKDCKSFKQQQEIVLEKTKNLAEGVNVALAISEAFKGKITDIKTL